MVDFDDCLRIEEECANIGNLGVGTERKGFASYMAILLVVKQLSFVWHKHHF